MDDNSSISSGSCIDIPSLNDRSMWTESLEDFYGPYIKRGAVAAETKQIDEYAACHV